MLAFQNSHSRNSRFTLRSSLLDVLRYSQLPPTFSSATQFPSNGLSSYHDFFPTAFHSFSSPPIPWVVYIPRWIGTCSWVTVITEFSRDGSLLLPHLSQCDRDIWWLFLYQETWLHCSLVASAAMVKTETKGIISLCTTGFAPEAQDSLCLTFSNSPRTCLGAHPLIFLPNLPLQVRRLQPFLIWGTFLPLVSSNYFFFLFVLISSSRIPVSAIWNLC